MMDDALYVGTFLLQQSVRTLEMFSAYVKNAGKAEIAALFTC